MTGPWGRTLLEGISLSLFIPFLLSESTTCKGPKEQLGPCHPLEDLGGRGHITGLSGPGYHLHSNG